MDEKRAPVAGSGGNCASYRAQPTLSQEASGKAILKAPRVSVEPMDVKEFFKLSRNARLKWYCSKLCAYQDQLFESSRRNNVPAQLIAACVLNELADIKFQDVWQERLGAFKGSFGPAQMQVKTAVDFGHVDVPRQVLESNAEANEFKPEFTMPGAGYLSLPPSNAVLHSYVVERLKIMQVGIEAAAREIARLLSEMAKHKANSWQKQHAFNAPAPAVAPHPEIYFQKNSIRGLTDQERFEQLCELVIAAYNSPLIVIAMNPGKSVLCSGDSAASVYFDGRNHGFNGATIGADIFHEGLFVQRA